MKIKDPVSGISHLIGAVLSLLGTIILLYSAYKQNDVSKIVSFFIFGGSMLFLYTSSAIYHLFGHSPEEVDIYRKIDHAMIYILIAGTYTPFCLVALKGAWGISTLITIWILAGAGISTVFFKSFWTNVPRWFATFLYILMGWLSMIIVYPLFKATNIETILWLFLGGLFYTVGAVIYAKKKPNISKGFGFHELFHILVLLGTMSHFWLIYKYILPL
ncbi:MAG: hemolysin III family protein [Candidatus Paceibacterota bacterium]|jgi:hemolysin III